MSHTVDHLFQDCNIGRVNDEHRTIGDGTPGEVGTTRAPAWHRR